MREREREEERGRKPLSLSPSPPLRQTLSRSIALVKNRSNLSYGRGQSASGRRYATVETSLWNESTFPPPLLLLPRLSRWSTTGRLLSSKLVTKLSPPDQNSKPIIDRSRSASDLVRGKKKRRGNERLENSFLIKDKRSHRYTSLK